MKLILSAIATHFLGTTFTYVMGIRNAGLWDIGHAVIPALPGLALTCNVITSIAPIVTGFAEKYMALEMYATLTCMRGLIMCFTILPSIHAVHLPLNMFIGHNRDLIFSGHTAFVASWILQRPTRLTLSYGAVHAVIMLAARQHYTIDVVLAWVFAYLVRRVPQTKISLRLALPEDDPGDLQKRVWVDELQQYRAGHQAPETNVTLVARNGDRLVGYISVSPPSSETSIDRHFGMQMTRDDEYEIRALTVHPGQRRRGIAKALMYAALRYVEASGGENIAILAREQVLGMYESLGFEPVPDGRVRVGGVRYVLARSSTASLRARFGDERPRADFSWDLPFDVERIGSCFHGGGTSLEALGATSFISADVLDAWYPPSPDVVGAVTTHLAESMHTTPPSGAPELTNAIATSRGVEANSILVGPGSSDLIYRCFIHWLSPESNVLLLDPTYGEYAHVLERVIGCKVTRYRPDGDPSVLETLAAGMDLVVIVNPNSPTGIWTDLTDVLPRLSAHRVWIDETYVEYAGANRSVEAFAATSMNTIVCKSMSKIYGLSGLRLAYLCASPMMLEAIRARTPPWNVSRLAQLAGVAAFTEGSRLYYESKIQETHGLRERMIDAMEALGITCFRGCANFIMFRVASPQEFVDACARRGVFIRTVDDASFVRVAVKDEVTNAAMIAVFKTLVL